MTTFLITIRKTDNDLRYYVGGCRVKRQTFYALGGPRDCLVTIQTKTHWKHYSEGRL